MDATITRDFLNNVIVCIDHAIDHPHYRDAPNVRIECN